MRTKLLYGAYGTGNLGDDLLLKAALKHHRAISSDFHIKVVSYGKPYLEEEINFIDHDDFIANPAKYISAQTDLHFCGGGLFWAPTHCDDMLKVAAYQKSCGGSVHIERIGTQGFHCNPDAVKDLFLLSDSNSVRDKMSADILSENNVCDFANPSFDYVLTLNNSIYALEKPSKPTIAINHSATVFYRDAEHRTKSLRIYKRLALSFKDQVSFVYFPQTRHFRCIDQNDIITGEQFWCFSKGLIQPIPFPTTAEEALRTFSTFSGAIGWRYHLLVLAKLFSIPSAYLGQASGSKYVAFAKENAVPMINFDLNEETILQSCKRFVQKAVL